MDQKLRILYYGSTVGNSGSRLKGMRRLGHTVETVTDRHPVTSAPKLWRSLEWRLCNGPMTWRLNRMFLRRADEFRPDLVWVEMGRLVYASTLEKIRARHGCLLANSYSDDFLDPMKVSRHYNAGVKLFDYIFTPREVNFPEYRRCGARHVGKFWKGFDPDSLFPEDLTEDDRRTYGTDVTFIGHCEQSRIEPLGAVAEGAGKLIVWGNGWQRFELPDVLRPCVMFRGAEGHEYRKAMCGAKIAVQYMSRWARDTQSSRSFEIPACGVFMLAERTDDHLACFEEDKEAAFFSSTAELVDKAKFYLAHDDLRRTVAEAGRRRCIESGYSNYDRIKTMLAEVLAANPDFRPPSLSRG